MKRTDDTDERSTWVPTIELAPAPRKIPLAFRLAEVLQFRWRYVWTLLVIGVAPIGLWVEVPKAFAVVAVATLAGIYAVQLWGARIRLGLLRWGRVATVVSRATHHGGTTWYNVYLPVAHGWHVTRRRWSGPNTTTAIRYVLDDRDGSLVVRGREYANGVILADDR